MLEEIADSWEAARCAVSGDSSVYFTDSSGVRNPLITLTLAPTRRGTSFISNGAIASSSKRPRSDVASNSQSPRRSASPSKKKKREESGVIVVDSSDVEEIEELGEDGGCSVPRLQLTRVDLTPCPLCAAVLPVSSIPGHIDRGCKDPATTRRKGGKDTKATWKNLFAGSASAKTQSCVFSF